MSLGRPSLAAALVVAVAAVFAAEAPARGDITITGGFGPRGDVGFTPATSPPNLAITFGNTLGSIYQMDTFVNAPTVDFGDGLGVSHQFANGPVAQLATTFSASALNVNDLLLNYTFRNISASALPGLKLFFYIDPDISPPNATGPTDFATVAGAPGSLPFANTFQVGDPQLSSILTNLNAGTLSQTNGSPQSTPGDVSMALGFNIGNLGVGETVRLQVLLSDAGASLPGGLILTDLNTNPSAAGVSLRVSGLASVPEPSPLALGTVFAAIGLGLTVLRRARRTASP